MPEGQIIMSKIAQSPTKGNLRSDLPVSDGRRTSAWIGGRVRRSNVGVISFAPFMALAGFLSSTTALSFGTMVASSILAGEALAQCTTSGTTTNCTGTISAKQTITSTGSVTVNLDGSATIENSGSGNAAHALEVSGDAGVTIVQASPGGVITAGTGGTFRDQDRSRGIEAVSSSGNVNVTTRGVITARGTGGEAIYLKAGGNITLSAFGNLVNSHSSGGPVVRLIGSGNITANVSSAATTHTSSGDKGMTVNTTASGKNINLTLGSINSRGNALEVQNAVKGTNNGTGTTTVSATTISSRNKASVTLSSFTTGTISANVTTLNHQGEIAGMLVTAAYGDVNITVSTVQLFNRTGYNNGNGSKGIRIGPYFTSYTPGASQAYIKSSGTITISVTTLNANTSRGRYDGNADGIFAQAKNATFDIDVPNVSATGDGIFVRGKNIEITSTGSIIAGEAGIKTDSRVSGLAGAVKNRNITITVASISAGNDGISIFNGHAHTAQDPGGFVRITTNSAISSTNSAGIVVQHSGTELTVSTNANVTGSTSGIYLRNYGTGPLNISTSATVTSSGRAVVAYNSGTTLTVTAAAVVGTSGIYVKNSGTGIATVTVANATTTNSSQGGKGAVYVYSKAGATVNVASANGGRLIDIRNASSGDITLTSTATFQAELPVFVKNTGTGKAIITLPNVSSTASGSTAIGAVYAYSKGGTEINITTISGKNRSLVVKNSGASVAEVTVSNAYVAAPQTPTYSSIGAVYVYSKGGTDVDVETASGIDHAVFIKNNGTGIASADIETATIWTSGATAVHVESNAGTDIDVAAATGKELIRILNTTSGTLKLTSTGNLNTGGAGSGAIYAKNTGTGPTEITLNGVSAQASSSAALEVYSKGGTDITVSSASGTNKAIVVKNSGASIAEVTVTSASVTSNAIDGSGAVYVYSKGGADVKLAGASGGKLVHIHNAVTGTVSFTSTAALTAGLPVYIRNTGNSAARVTLSSITSTNSGTTAQGAIFVYSKGGIVANIIDATGATKSITLNNSGVGAVSFTSTGTITASGQLGVSNSAQHAITITNNASTGTNVSVSANIVSGFISGINATNSGSGTVSIRVSGAVTGTNGSAIYGTNSGTTMTISTFSTVSGRDGIVLKNNGTGLTTIDANGTITATGATPAAKGALYVLGKGGITIDVGVITGAKNAVNIKNTGPGTVSFTATGSVTSSANQSGVIVENGSTTISTGSDIDINVVAVSGSAAGVFTQNFGTGDIDVSATGIVTGVSGHGIFASNNNGGSIEVTASASITGSGNSSDGINVTNDDEGSSITITPLANVTGGRKGIYSKNDGDGGTTITLSGKVTATVSTGIHAIDNGGGVLTVSANSTEGISALGHTGIVAMKGGTGNLVVHVTGPINAVQGITTRNASSDTSVTALGGITAGNSFPIFAIGSNSGALTVVTSGTVSGASGVWAQGGGTNVTVTVENVVSRGASDAINARNYGNGDTRVTTSGTISGGGSGIGVIARGGDSVFITAQEAVTGSTNGINVNMSNAGSANITAQEDVRGNGYAGIKVYSTLSAGTTVSIDARGNVSGARQGLFVDNQGSGGVTISVTGDLIGTSLYGLRARNYTGGGMSVNTQGDISGGLTGLLVVNKGDAATSVTVSGDVASRNGHGLVLTDEANQDAIISIGGTITSSGTDLTTSTAADGVSVNQKGGALTFSAQSVSAAGDGIVVKNTTSAGSQTFNISGAVTGSAGGGISVTNESSGDFSVTTSGNIIAGGGHGVQATISSESTITVVSLGEIQANGVDFDGVNVSTAGAATLDITTSGGIISQEGSGIMLNSTGTGDVEVDVTTGSSGVVGSIGVGIHVVNTGGGAVTVDAKSLVTGRRTRTGANNISIGNEGILIVNDASGASVTVNATAVTSSGHAIHADNRGAGATSVTTTGVVLGGTDGIRAYAGSTAATTLTVDTKAAVTGSSGIGIHAQSKGSGLVTISTAGSVIGGSGDGVHVFTESSGVTITVNEVRGATDGIEAFSKAGGSISVIASGNVMGRTGKGISAIAAGETVEVSATSVSGGVTGVEVKNTGIGAVTINLTRAIRGIGMDGIYAYNSSVGADLTIVSSGTVTGGSDRVESEKDDGESEGIQALNLGSGATSVTVRGAVSGGNHGILLTNSGTDVTIIAGTVSSANHGIKVENMGAGATSLTFSGNVTGSKKHGITFNGSSTTTTLSVVTRGVTAGADGIKLTHPGTDASVSVSGNISAATDGLTLAATGQSGVVTVSVTGNIVAGNDGLKVSTVSDGNISVTNTGNINASGDALHVSTTGNGNVTLGFSGTITSSGAGLQVVGTSSATTESGNNFTVTTIGGITATDTAIHVSNSGASGATTIVASGSLASSESHGLVAIAHGASVSVTATGDVTADGNAFYISNNGTGTTVLASSGSVNGGSAGIVVKGAASSLGVTVTTENTVLGNSVGLQVDHKGNGAVAVTAKGNVTGAGRVANANRNGVDVYLGRSGTTATLNLIGVSGSVDGVKLHNKGSGATTISATDNIVGTGGHGINLYGNTGQISVNVLEVTGADGGIEIVAKTGNITVSTKDVSSSEGSGITISANGVGVTSVTTSGAVTGRINGIDVRRGTASPTGSGDTNDINIVTNGNVTGQGVAAVTGSGNVPSSAAVPGSGIYARHIGRGDINITIIDGEIKGGNGGLPIDADAVNGVANINLGSGAVIGTPGSTAIQHGEGDSVMIVNPGSRIRGNIKLGGGKDVLRLQGGIIDDEAELDGGNDAAINSSVDVVYFAPVVGSNQVARTKIIGSNLKNWERIVVEQNAQMVISGQQSLETQEFTNLGSVDMLDNEPDDVLSVTGNYVGGGLLYIDANFATESADRLTINGDVIGVTELRITDTTNGALATGRDFWVINVDGAVSPNAFELKRAIRVDGIDYRLIFDESRKAFVMSVGIGNPLDIDTMLVAAPAALSRTFANAPSMMQRRQGLLPWTNEGESQDGTWMRYFGATNDHGLVGTGGSFQSDQTVFQYGYDLLAFDFGNGGWSVGITAQTGTVTANAEGAGGVGTIESTGYGIGTTATWFGRDGSYLDLQGQINFVETEFANIRHGNLTEAQKSEAWVASMELGRRMHLGGGLSIIPQGQLSVGQLAGSEFETDRGNQLSYDSHLSLNARFGVAAEYFGDRSRGYIVGNFMHNFSDTWEVRVDKISVNDKISPSAIEFGIGGSVASTDSTTLFIEASYRLGVGGEKNSQESSAMLATGVQWSW